MKGINKDILKFVGRYNKPLALCSFFIFCSLAVFPQFRCRFQINNMPVNHLSDSLFVAGSFNNWDPGKTGNQFSTINDPGIIEINEIQAGEYQFKFTRGSWQSVECRIDGNDIGNRMVKIYSDTVIQVTIAAWMDDFVKVAKHHTATPSVYIIDTAFEMPQLRRTRKIWLYLPPGYAKSKKHYPVMYMQDGQNLFDAFTAGFSEWGIDESVDSLINKGKPACIIVGIENGPNRLTEYNPFEFKDFGKGEGDQYVDFIVENLKPYIDKHYRTLHNNENTIIAGSSMGGLISYYAMLKYPEVFGKGGIFSPAFWTADKIKEITNSSGKNLKGTLFFYIGGMEGERYIKDMVNVIELLAKNSTALIYTITDPEGSHNEKDWGKWFPEFYNWVLASGFNNLIILE